MSYHPDDIDIDEDEGEDGDDCGEEVPLDIDEDEDESYCALKNPPMEITIEDDDDEEDGADSRNPFTWLQIDIEEDEEFARPLGIEDGREGEGEGRHRNETVNEVATEGDELPDIEECDSIEADEIHYICQKANSLVGSDGYDPAEFVANYREKAPRFKTYTRLATALCKIIRMEEFEVALQRCQESRLRQQQIRPNDIAQPEVEGGQPQFNDCVEPHVELWGVKVPLNFLRVAIVSLPC